jgi:hypothetical protein
MPLDLIAFSFVIVALIFSTMIISFSLVRSSTREKDEEESDDDHYLAQQSELREQQQVMREYRLYY